MISISYRACMGPTSLVVPGHHANPTRCRPGIGFFLECHTRPGVKISDPFHPQFALGVSNARACELDIITGNGADLAFGVSDFNSFESFAKAMKDVAKNEFNGCI